MLSRIDMKNGYYRKMKDGLRLFVYDYKPVDDYRSTIFLLAGITGINHIAEHEMIDILSNGENRVVVVHPRGTGFSEGRRGDLQDFSVIASDYLQIISKDKDYQSRQHRIVLYGHSMSAALLLSVADMLDGIDGAVIVNPPCMLKKAKGMSPAVDEYLKYGWYYLFDRHEPVVNMAGDPSVIANEADRREALDRINDPLLVDRFSMYMMLETRKLMRSMYRYASRARYPLLLISGEDDPIVDQRGCYMLFQAWKCESKQFLSVEKGSHGRSTVILAKEPLKQWIKEL